MLFIIALSTCCVFLVLYAIYQYAQGEKQQIQERVTRYAADSGNNSMKPVQPRPQGSQVPGVVKSLGKLINTIPTVRHVDNKMLQAGLSLRGSEFIVLSLGISAAIGSVVSILSKGKFVSGVVGGLVCYLSCWLYVQFKIGQRRKAFNRQLIDAISMIANSLRSGFSFLQAAELVSREMPAPISQEFNRLIKEINLGITTEDALANMAERVQSSDLDLVVTSVLIQRQIGGNLSQILDSIGATIRGRVTIQREIKTLTSQGRYSGWVVGLLPFAVVILILLVSPQYFDSLLSDKLGNAIMAGAVASQLLGVMLIRKIVNIDI